MKRFKALPESAQNAILDEHRDWNIVDEWWDYVDDMFRQDMVEKGIKVDAMYFSGFWSQGDGACFTGRIDDWKKFFEAHPMETYKAFKDISEAEDDFDLYLGWGTSGRYSHADTMYLNDYTQFDWIDTGRVMDPLEALSLKTLNDDAKKLWGDFQKDVLELLRDYANKLYEDLEEEYEYLTSDEAILESLIANGRLEALIKEQEQEQEEEEADEDEPAETPTESMA